MPAQIQGVQVGTEGRFRHNSEPGSPGSRRSLHQRTKPRVHGSFSVRRSPSAAIEWLEGSGIAVGVCDVPIGSTMEVHGNGVPAYTVYLALEGAVGMRSDEGIFAIPEGRIELQPLERATTLTSKFGARGVLVLIPAEVLHRRLSRSGARYATARAAHSVRLDNGADSPAMKLLSDCLAGIACHSGRDTGLTGLGRAGELLLTALQEAIEEPAKVSEPTQGHPGPWYVKLAESYIDQSAHRTIDMADIANAAGVSPRTLHEGFKRHRGASPMRYLRHRRISGVRSDLTSPQEATTVTDVALKWGFNHLGRFSGYYSQQFGESPSETLRAARLRCTV
jgi:AraC-like DNA-binding protein